MGKQAVLRFLAKRRIKEDDDSWWSPATIEDIFDDQGKPTDRISEKCKKLFREDYLDQIRLNNWRLYFRLKDDHCTRTFLNEMRDPRIDFEQNDDGTAATANLSL